MIKYKLNKLNKKYLQDKLLFLESEFKKYKYLIEKSENNRKISNRDSYIYSSEDSIENFSNSDNTKDDTKNDYVSNTNRNDIIDLFLLIIIGLIVIFVINSIFNIGKKIGASSKS